MSKATLGTRLRLEEFHGLKEELAQWRLNEELQKGILGFVKGLRLSARLIYAIRNHLSSFGYEVDWGHLLTDEETSCSPECDIIIHTPGHVREWNGTQNPVMNFKFIKCENAVAVVSCKSFIKSIDRKYSTTMKKYVDNIFLFAECCEPCDLRRLKKAAKTAGYKGFWYLYACDKKTMKCTIDDRILIHFLDALKLLVEKRSKRSS